MPDIKLKNGSGVEQVYTGVDTITVPLADGTGTHTFGLTDEELNFTSGLGVFQKNRFANSLLSPSNIKRIKFSIGDDAENGLVSTFAYSDYEDLSDIKITFTTPNKTSTNKLQDTFVSCKKLKHLPVITNTSKVEVYGNASNFNFSYCHLLSDEELAQWFSHFMNTTTSNFQSVNWFQNCYSLKDASWFGDVELFTANKPSSIYYLFGYCVNLEKMVLPILGETMEVTSNMFGTSNAAWNYTPMLSSMTLKTTENGLPYTVRWKGQTLEFLSSNQTGWSNAESNIAPMLDYGSNTAENNIFYGCSSSNSTIDLDTAQSRYEILKNNPNWYSIAYNSVTYNGTNVKAAMLFSKFNHDSMVELINSLPDTSAYLAAKGGTNTIKFNKYLGALTDAGGAENLTDEEIAVATSKGWTISLVTT